MENRIPSTDPITWGAKFNKGDKVRVRIDFSDIRDTNNVYEIINIENGRKYEGVVRPENPSGNLYILSNNGGNWEGKDLELVSASETSQSNDIKRDSNVYKDINSLSSFVEFDTLKDKITILRVKPPQNGGTPPPDDGTPPQPPEPQPDNVKDPFEDTPPPPKDDKNPDGKDGDGDGEGNDGEGKDGEGNNGEGKDGEGKDGEGADSEFGDDDSDLESLEEMLKKIKDDFDRGKSTKDIQLQQDLDILENALSTPKDQIKNIFRSKSIVLSAIGRRNIFGTDNEERLNDTLNEIFK